jgi:hypothetical protein
VFLHQLDTEATPFHGGFLEQAFFCSSAELMDKPQLPIRALSHKLTKGPHMNAGNTLHPLRNSGKAAVQRQRTSGIVWPCSNLDL